MTSQPHNTERSIDHLETAKVARENPDAVRDFAHRVDEPLKSRLLEIVNRVERGESDT